MHPHAWCCGVSGEPTFTPVDGNAAVALDSGTARTPEPLQVVQSKQMDAVVL